LIFEKNDFGLIAQTFSPWIPACAGMTKENTGMTMAQKGFVIPAQAGIQSMF
jgi:hypothetical protein